MERENEAFEDKDLVEDSLTGAEFVDCVFKNCTAENSILRGCSFTDCTFIGCTFVNLTPEHCNMSDSLFTDCRITGVSWGDYQFGGSYLLPIRRLEGCTLKYNNFVEMNLARCDFSGNTILFSMFADCNLTAAKFLKCNLDSTEFFRCNLTKADFRNASGYAVDLAESKLKGARFSYPDVVGLLNGLGIIIE